LLLSACSNSSDSVLLIITCNVITNHCKMTATVIPRLAIAHH
jgi:hypothetical protein